MKGLLLFIVFLWISPAFCQSAGDELQKRLNAMHSMTAKLSQVVKSKQRLITQSSGTMALERPGRFRWQTKKPMEQLLIADGKKIWVYDVDLEQVTVKNQDDRMEGTAALFLSGENHSLIQDFEVTLKTSPNQFDYQLRSRKGKGNFQRLILIFDHERLTRMELFDQPGQHTTINFNNIQWNPRIDARLFQFNPPKGTDVVQQ